MTIKGTLAAAILVVTSFAGGVAAQAPAGDAPAPEFVLGPSDVLRVWVWQEADLAATVVVTPDGKISVPLAGELDVSGRTRAEVEAELRERLATYLGEPVVTLIVEQVNSSQVSVLGEVNDAGVFPMVQPLSVLDALALAGGFSEFADRGNVIILRRTADGSRRLRFDVGRFLDDGRGELPYLHPGDVVYVR